MGLPEDAEEIARRLREIRERHGEAAFKDACRDMAKQFLGIPNGDAIIRRFFPELDPDELKAEGPQIPDTPAMPSMPGADQMMLQMLKAQIPNLQTQAQFNVFMACFDALRSTLNSYFGGEAVSAEMARETLNQALDMARQLAEVTEKLGEMPEEVKSEAAKEFTRPAKELHEYDEARALIIELECLSDQETFRAWYEKNRERLDRIVSQKLRNEVFDAIRGKRRALGAN